MTKKLISLVIIVLFLGSCVIPSLSGLKQNIIQSYFYNKETNDDILPPEELWNKTFNEYGYGKYIRETSDGGYKIISTIYDSTYRNLVIAFIKTDKDANIESKKAINLFENDDMDIDSIKETSEGGYLFAGRNGGYSGDVIWDDGIFLLKTDANGNEEWNFKYDFKNYMSYVTIKTVSECPDGSFIISGMIEDFDEDDYDDGILLLKFNEYGYKEWDIRITHGKEELKCIYPTDDGGCLLGGYISKDAWIRKLDKWGKEEWETVFEEGHGDIKEYASYIHPASDEGYIIVVASNSNYFRIIKIDDLGNEISTKKFDDGSIFSIQKTDDDGFIVFSKKSDIIKLIRFNSAGSDEYLNSFKYIDYRDGWIYSKRIRKTSDGGYILLIGTYFDGFWLIKIDSLGNKLWENNVNIDIEMKDYFYCKDIAETNDDGYIICGNHNYVYEEGSYSRLWLIRFAENNPPSIPVLEGGNKGRINEDYTFSTSSVDSENDLISYLFDWDDGTESSWTEYDLSGNTVDVMHNWTKEGSYNIKVKARDEHGYESDWSDPLKVSMPKVKDFSFSRSFILRFIRNIFIKMRF